MEKEGIFEKLELWALTAVFVLTIPSRLVFDIIQHSMLFVSIMYINFKIVDGLMKGERLIRNILLLIGFALVITAATAMGLSGHIYPHELAEQTGFVLLAIAGYVVVKRAALYIISKTEGIQSFFVIFNRESTMAFGLWMCVMYWLILIRIPTEVRLAWMSVIPTGILLHGVAFYYFIPGSLKWKYPLIAYFFRVAIFCFAIGLAVSLIMTIITDDEEHGFTIGVFSGSVHFFLTSPILWLIYRWQMKGREQITALQGELGRSAANVDFLRSQINPHFLFNALNTIYGLAIQEKAQRTSESVEKLGDMMRFMLSENMQQRTSLVRELEYLDNYISLQRLRTDSNTGVKIQVDIQQEIAPTVQISPMLLIPFVENAFKHGISLREESSIKISLELKDTTLYFDVQNSRHTKTENDPEKDSNGVGLANVRQRLEHMYAGKHELLIRETNRDFFVHLRIQLD